MIANNSPIANQSCTNVAPCRHESENGSYQRMMAPLISMTTIAAPMNVAFSF